MQSEYGKILKANRIGSERQISWFRLLIVVFNLILVILVMSANHFHVSLSDLFNLAFLALALGWTFFLLFLLGKGIYHRWMAFASSTLDVILISLSIYAVRYSPEASVATIPLAAAFAVYFPIIIFSIRRHDALNSLYTGFLAGTIYVGLIGVMAMEGGIGAVLQSPEGMVIRTNLVNELTKAVMLFASGIIGYLTARNFDNVLLESVLREKEIQLVKRSFGEYVSHELADEILSGRIPLAGEKREITLLFMDLRDFTSLTERTDAQTLVRILNAYFEFVMDIVRRYGGFIDKFIGDAVMVEFGAPVEMADHREKAVLCAIELVEKRLELNRKVKEITGNERELSFGIGINTGEAIVGNVGSEDRKSYTALGDAVNIAARLESMTKELNSPLVIGEAVYRPMFAPWFDEPRSVQLKGKSKVTLVYVMKPRT